LDVAGVPDTLPEQQRTCVYRVVQEALTNCARHARATSVHVQLTGLPDRLELTIADDGVGLSPERRQHGIGLRGMEERVRELGGTMTIQAVPGSGTTVAIRLPLPPGSPSSEVALARAAG